MIADFATPTAPTGWLECTGGAVSRSTYSDLFIVTTIRQEGTRVSTAIGVSGLTDTSNMKVGYYISGTGIPIGTTIATVTSATTLDMSLAATSSGTGTITVSPWPLGDGLTTFNLPSAARRFRRSRQVGVTDIGLTQADALASHDHTATTTGTANSAGDHAHGLTTASASSGGAHPHALTTAGVASHTHPLTVASAASNGAHIHTITDPTHAHTYSLETATFSAQSGGGTNTHTSSVSSASTSGDATNISIDSGGGHTHTLSGSTDAATPGLTGNTDSGGAHTHPLSGNTDTTGAHTHTLTAATTVNATGSAETRPLTLVVMTCIKT